MDNSFYSLKRTAYNPLSFKNNGYPGVVAAGFIRNK